MKSFCDLIEDLGEVPTKYSKDDAKQYIKGRSFKVKSQALSRDKVRQISKMLLAFANFQIKDRKALGYLRRKVEDIERIPNASKQLDILADMVVVLGNYQK